MRSDPFLLPVPRKLSEDPEMNAYFSFLNKVLHDLTTNSGDPIEDATGSNDTDVLNSVVAQMRSDGTIKS